MQEVVDTERPIIKDLQANSFEIVYLKDAPDFDTAIALNTKRFKNIKNLSMNIRINDFFNKDVYHTSVTSKSFYV